MLLFLYYFYTYLSENVLTFHRQSIKFVVLSRVHCGIQFSMNVLHMHFAYFAVNRVCKTMSMPFETLVSRSPALSLSQ